ncbi:MAG: hypothetical protein M1833_002894 [Piccolia ochrophora]|nr:MAG: hypothetical protein M1833_002894 [Piccolia ochrophora]
MYTNILALLPLLASLGAAAPSPSPVENASPAGIPKKPQSGPLDSSLTLSWITKPLYDATVRGKPNPVYYALTFSVTEEQVETGGPRDPTASFGASPSGGSTRAYKSTVKGQFLTQSSDTCTQFWCRARAKVDFGATVNIDESTGTIALDSVECNSGATCDGFQIVTAENIDAIYAQLEAQGP